MSKLRPCLTTGSDKPCPDEFDSYYMIRDSVENAKGLIHGKLHDDRGRSCAIGSFFDTNAHLALPTKIVDEVAAYNDSIPKDIGMRERRVKVLRWLNDKLEYLKKRGPRANAV